MNARRCHTLLLLLLVALLAKAQREVTNNFGAGWSNQYDTYLSPVEYRGFCIAYVNETLHRFKRNSNIAYQGLTTIDISRTRNLAHTKQYLGGNIDYTAIWAREWSDGLWQGLSLRAGGMLDTNIGFLYNNRNGNNPAQGYFAMQVGASVSAKQSFRIRNKQLSINYQANLPLLGAMFSPNYDQGYYELGGLGNYDHNIVCTHPDNALSLRQQLSIDIPIRKAVLCFSYLSDLRQAKPNNLRQHHYNRVFLLGWKKGI